MKGSQLAKTFAKAAGCVAIAGAATAGATAAYPQQAAETFSTSATDVYFNFMSPELSNADYQASLEDGKLSLGSVPDVIPITAESPQTAVDQVVRGVKESIIKNGGPLNRIVFSGDGQTNAIADPMPNDQCRMKIPLLRDPRFCITTLTSLLQGLVTLQNQDFPGHRAGDPLAQAVDVNACNVFATHEGLGRLPAKEISQLAAQLNMPIIASVTRVGYSTWTPAQDTGLFWAILPNGNVAELPGPYHSFIEDDVNANMAWIEEDGFTVQKVTEPVKNMPYSFINNVDVSVPNKGPQRTASAGKSKIGFGVG